MNDRVTITIEDGVADVRFNRPDKMNALDGAMFEGIATAGDRLRGERGLRAVVLSGEGRAFCAGIDLASFGEGLPDLVPRTHGRCNLFQHAAMLWRALPVPVIAAIHGACLGGGLQIALGADIRIAAPDARLSVMEIRWGLVPDMGAFALARGLVREDRMRALTYEGRMVDAREAADIGLVTSIADDPKAAAMTMAQAIAARNPDAVRGAKALFDSWGGDTAAILNAESVTQARLLGSPNQREAVAAAMDKRPPRFSD